MIDCTKIINDISRNWKLTNAQYANDGPDYKAGETRTDGRYPPVLAALIPACPS